MFTFEELPRLVGELIQKTDKIEKMLLNAVEINQKKPEDELFTVDETAKFLNLTQQTIYTKVCRGDLPYMKQGKRLYFSKKELLEHLLQGRRKTNKQLNTEAAEYVSNIAITTK